MREVPSPSSMIATFLVALSLVACETVPYTGRSQLQLISPQEEGQMGVQAYQQILGKAKISSLRSSPGARSPSIPASSR